MGVADDLKSRAELISKWDIELLIRPKNAGSFTFETQKQRFEQIQSFFREIAGADFSMTPVQFLEPGKTAAESLIGSLSAIRDFSFRSGDPNQAFSSLIANLEGAWRQAYERMYAHLAFSRLMSGTIEREFEGYRALVNTTRTESAQAAENLSNRVNAADEQLRKQKEELAAKITELENVMAVARESAKTSAVATQATAFSEEADSAKTASNWWLITTIGSVAVGLVVVWFLFLKDLQTGKSGSLTSLGQRIATNAPPMTGSAVTQNDIQAKAVTAAFVQQTVARILIVTLVYSAVVWCARNYFASRHNFTVNRHRRNAMQTFRAFVEGSTDQPTRDFILRQAAQCAFSPQQTGYLKDESLPTPGPASQIIDVVRPEAKVG